ncbi:P-loop containing nucleoside triphosphate hydrolase protein [Trametes cingulata]|nr:P-loop containing nucleoside triphosphate hydrolase protein [Trametes cingulata]
MAEEFSRRANGQQPFAWQLDAAEAIVLGLDCVVVAGTGAGKTIPYILPLFLPEFRDKLMVIISPLKSLQQDQARRFRKLGLRAAAVNGETWCDKLQKDLLARKYQVVLTGPEMCVRNAASRELFTTMGVAGHLGAIIVDEAHCISQWGGDFRTAYSELDRLRAIVRDGVSISAFSATMAPGPFHDVVRTLRIDLGAACVINLGNDRPNIKYSMRIIRSTEDFRTLDTLLEFDSFVDRSDIPKTIIFANTRDLTQRLWRYVQGRLKEHLSDAVDFIHSLRTRYARIRTLARFKDGPVRILIGTESVGMGADIPDVQRVIQYGVPSSLSVWTQRAGRAGRSPHISAEAVMLVERAVFQHHRGRQPPKKSNARLASTHGPHAWPGKEGAGYRKQIEPALREWIETKGCRRAVSDRYFGNPALEALKNWRAMQAEVRYAHTVYTVEAILPEKVLRTLAHHAELKTMDNLRAHFKNGRAWALLPRHGSDVLNVLRAVDEEWLRTCASQSRPIRKGKATSGSKAVTNQPYEVRNNPELRCIVGTHGSLSTGPVLPT